MMPAVFVGHGSPMNTLEVNRYTSAWRALGAAMPTPRAILAISAHWFINGSAVTAMATPRVIHDFYGFPKELFDFDYPAPGDPQLAEEIVEIARPMSVALDHDSWGIDHGTWSVLAHMFPQANVPVVQLSIHAGHDIDYHIELGKRLAPLRDRGVLILGSGNVVHNLRRVAWDHGEHAFDWALEFDAEVKRVMTTQPDQLARVAHHPAYTASVPTPEHFLPLAYLAGVCAASGEPAKAVIEGGSLGSLTMTSYAIGCRISAAPYTVAGAGTHAASIPAEDTNM